jgi:hypothetical protein
MSLNAPNREAAGHIPQRAPSSSAATVASKRTEFTIPIVFIPFGLLFLGTCLAGFAWLALHGPALVPGQDTRITSILISTGSRMSVLIIGSAFVRSSWASILPDIVAEKPLNTRSLIGICQNFMSLGQLANFGSLPAAFKWHIVLAAFISLAMIATSSSFRYESLPVSSQALAILPDFASTCAPPRNPTPDGGNYFCTGVLNANTTTLAWNYIEQVYSGGQRTVYRYGELGDEELGANVTLAVLPNGWTPKGDNDLPWMSMSVKCQDLPISASYSGSGYASNASIYVNNTLIDTLDIANMPTWGSDVHLYQQVHKSGPRSSLCPWKVVMLGRNLYDGTANFGGLSLSGVTPLYETYLDLHGYGPVVQGILGAAVLCTFSGATGGQWPDILWPPLNKTSNTVIGTVINDRPTMGTAFLNYGPSWQYNPVGGNALPGGSISYIANNTGAGVSFSALFASYVRNQWTLMAYSITPNAGKKLSRSFKGSGPNKLYIQITAIGVLPCMALVIGILVSLRAWIYTIRYHYWVNRIEFESWWLVKALRADMYDAGYCNATEKDFDRACQNSSVIYTDTRPGSEIGHLAICSVGAIGFPVGISRSIDPRRIYGRDV